MMVVYVSCLWLRVTGENVLEAKGLFGVQFDVRARDGILQHQGPAAAHLL